MLSALLAEREKDGKPIRVGIIGTGKFGGGLVTQIGGTGYDGSVARHLEQLRRQFTIRA